MHIRRLALKLPFMLQPFNMVIKVAIFADSMHLLSNWCIFSYECGYLYKYL